MMRHITTSVGSAILGASLFLSLFLITSSVNKIESISSNLEPHNQVAQISGAGSGLVAHYTFDEGSGTTAGDSAGSNAGKLMNGSTWDTVENKIGASSVSFDGQNDYIQLPNTLTGLSNSEGTFSAWASARNWRKGVQQNFSFLKVDNNNYFSVFLHSSNIIISRISTGGVSYQTTYTIPTTFSGWHHITTTWSATTNQIVLYVDGVQVGTPASFSAIGSATVLNYLGGNATSAVFDGTLDDVRIYNRALSASEVAELYAYTGGGTTPTPTAVNGSCGSTQNTCTTGTLNDTADTSTNYQWQCTGSNGGSTASCTLPIPSTPTDTTPPTISNIQSSSITTTGATITWTTNESADTQVEYGLTTAYGNTTSLNSSLVTSHSQSLSSLNPNTTYHYRVKSKDAAGNEAVSGDQTFSTVASTPVGGNKVERLNSSNSVIGTYTTIQACADVAVAGDTCLVSAGTYREEVVPVRSGNNGLYITYKAKPGNRVIISGSDEVSNWTIDQGNIYKASVTKEPSALFEDGKILIKARTNNGDINDPYNLHKGPVFTTDVGTNATQIVDFELTQTDPNYYIGAKARIRYGNNINREVLITNYNPQTHTLTLGNSIAGLGSGVNYFLEGLKEYIDMPGEWAWKDGVLYIMTKEQDDPTRHLIESDSRNRGFYIKNNQEYIVIDGFEIRQMKFNNWYDGAIYFSSTLNKGNIIIQNNKIYDAGDNGIIISGTWDSGGVYPSNITIRRNIISHVGGHGIMTRGEVQYGLIEDNEIAYSGLGLGDGIFIAQGGTGIARHWIIKGNYIHNAFTKGPIIIDGEDITVDRNFSVTGENDFAIGFTATPMTGRPVTARGNYTFSNNVIVGKAKGLGLFRFQTMAGSEFDGLKIYNNTIVGDGLGKVISMEGRNPGDNPLPTIKNIDIKNNLIYSPGNYMIFGFRGKYSEGFSSNYNHYVWGTNAKPFYWWESTPLDFPFTGWQSKGYDTFNHVQNTDPLFVNINNPLGPDGIPFTSDDGLQLRVGSPARGAGENGADIGAYEYTGAVVNPTTYTITASIIGQGTLSATGLSCTASTCTATPSTGSSVTITATPSTGYTFTGWSGSCTGTSTCTLSSAGTVTATFTTTVTPDTTLPTVSLTSPTGTISGTVTLAATAADNVGVVGVQFKLDGVNIGQELTTAPYSGAWNTLNIADGTHTLTATARDAAGNSRTSNPVSIFVNNNTAPVLATIGSKTVVAGTQLSFSILATDAQNNTLTYTAPLLPQGASFSNRTFTWTPTTAGTYSARFNVSDGILSDSETITITVTTPLPVDQDTDGDGVSNLNDKCPFTPIELRNEVNIYGCPKPRITKFTLVPDPATTDISTSLSSLDISNAYGKITYATPVNLYRDQTTYKTQLDIDSYLDITSGTVSLGSSSLPELNKTATVTLYNITYQQPRILKDGVVCTSCTLVSYTNNTYVFRVTGFSTYTIEEGAETTTTTTTTGGGGGGGGGSSSSTTRYPTGTLTPTVTQIPVSATQQVISEPSSIYAGLLPLTRNLYKGLRGEDVRNLQRFLVIEGLLTIDEPTTYYGSQTEAAVKLYQAKNNIVSVGSPATTGYGAVGPKTKASINQKIGSLPTTTISTPQTSTITLNLYKGLRHQQVATLQTYLKQKGYLDIDTVTTYYGSLTEAAVKKFQCATLSICSGTPDTNGYGRVGPKTRSVIK